MRNSSESDRIFENCFNGRDIIVRHTFAYRIVSLVRIRV
jgi:hypothetical protein